jgi:hypothetical protein
VSESIVTIAPAVAPKWTAVTGPPFATIWKFEPVIVTLQPAAPLVGVTAVIVGSAA